MIKPSTDSILHVFDSVGQLRFHSSDIFSVEEIDKSRKHLFCLMDLSGLTKDILGGDQSHLTFDRGLGEHPSKVHFHSMKSAINYFERLEDIPFSINFRNYLDPLSKPKRLSERKTVILKQREVLERCVGVFTDFEDQKGLIEDWFVELRDFGGGEYYYNFDRALEITQKCVANPFTPSHQYWNPDAVSDNKVLWLSAVYGIDLRQKYLSVYGPGTEWERLLNYYRSILDKDPAFRIVVFDDAPMDTIREKAALMDIPSSYLIHVSPSKKHLRTCMKMTIGNMFFPSTQEINYDMLASFLLMGIPVIAETDCSWRNLSNAAWLNLQKDNQSFKIARNDNSNAIRKEALSLFSINPNLKTEVQLS